MSIKRLSRVESARATHRGEASLDTRAARVALSGSLLLLVVVGILVGTGVGVAASGPVADFPSFTPTSAAAEGVAVDKFGYVYVSVREPGLGQILSFSPDGEPSLFAELGDESIGGLAVNARGDVFAANGGGPYQGVYRVGRDGEITLLPGTEEIVFANALAFDQRGNLYVTESSSFIDGSFGPGGIWRIPRRGEAELWLQDELLTGTGIPLGFPVGANGIAFYHGDLYVVNTDKGLVVRVPIMPDGAPGAAHVWAQLAEVYDPPVIPGVPLGDGLALDVHGNVYVTVVNRAAVVRINAQDKSQEAVAARLPLTPNNAPFAPLDTPASLAFGTGKGGREVLFVTNLGWLTPTGPGLVKIEAGAPGLPLP